MNSGMDTEAHDGRSGHFPQSHRRKIGLAPGSAPSVDPDQHAENIGSAAGQVAMFRAGDNRPLRGPGNPSFAPRPARKPLRDGGSESGFSVPAADWGMARGPSNRSWPRWISP